MCVSVCTRLHAHAGRVHRTCDLPPLPCLVLQSPLGSVRGYLPVWWLNPELSPSVSHVRCMHCVCVCLCVCGLVGVYLCFLHCLECFTVGILEKWLSVGSSGGSSQNILKKEKLGYCDVRSCLTSLPRNPDARYASYVFLLSKVFPSLNASKVEK